MSDMNALALANQLKAEWDGQGFQADTTKDAAAMLRRQHEAIQKLREALGYASTYVQEDEAERGKSCLTGQVIRKALKDTEEFK